MNSLEERNPRIRSDETMSETQKHTTRNGFITIIGTYIIWSHSYMIQILKGQIIKYIMIW